MTTNRGRLLLAVLLVVASNLACDWLLGNEVGQVSSASASPAPQLVVTSTPRPATPTSTATTPTVEQDDSANLELTLVPYPTPADSITAWTDLVDRTTLGAVRWAEFEGVISGKGMPVRVSISYPEGWAVSPEGGPALSLQNEPSESFPEYQGPFIKFEVLWLKGEPQTNGDLGHVWTVLISGERSILWEGEWLSTPVIAALVQEGATYYGVHGFINRVDDEQYRFYRNVILSMISSLEIGG